MTLIQLFLISLTLTVSTQALSQSVDCAALLRTSFLSASEADIPRRPAAWVSALSKASPEVSLDLPSRAGQDDHVVSLGSGPDIFRPMYVFPEAGHFHLVDLGNGWASGFAECFAELENRLHHLAPNTQVVRVKDGFLRHRPPPSFSKEYRRGTEIYQIAGPWRWLGNKWAYFTEPVVWHVSWSDPDIGKVERLVYLHVGDFSDMPFSKSVLRSTKGRLTGLFISGIVFPDRPALEIYLDDLNQGGLWLAEMESMNSQGQFTGSKEDAENERWLKSHLHQLRQVPTSDAFRDANPKFYYPTTYLFEKVWNKQ